jgi:hypothetical protein
MQLPTPDFLGTRKSTEAEFTPNTAQEKAIR